MPEIEEVDEMESKRGKEMRSRETWVRGYDHVLPIDYQMGTWKGPLEKLVELLEVDKLDPNERDAALGLTPLMKAASRGYLEAINVLLDHGADIDLRDNTGMTALHKCWKEHPECKELLLKRGATRFPWPKKNVFNYRFKSTGEKSYWEEIDDPDAPEDLEKEPLAANPEDRKWIAEPGSGGLKPDGTR